MIPPFMRRAKGIMGAGYLQLANAVMAQQTTATWKTEDSRAAADGQMTAARGQ